MHDFLDSVVRFTTTCEHEKLEVNRIIGEMTGMPDEMLHTIVKCTTKPKVICMSCLKGFCKGHIVEHMKGICCKPRGVNHGT